MKIKLVAALFFMAISVSFAQKNKQTPVVMPAMPVDSESGLITYSKVVEVSATPKDELYKRALAWANSYFKNPKDVIREQNAAAGKIVCKARYKIYNEPVEKKDVATDAGDVMYTLTIEFKDNRYRYEINRFNWQQISAFPAERWLDEKSPSFNPVYASYLTQTDKKIKEVTSNLEKKMQDTGVVTKEDW